MIRRLILISSLLAVPAFAVTLTQAVIGGQHDLTGSGSGPIKSTVADTCVFCHAPHNGIASGSPLWDQTLSIVAYTTYTSTTYKSGTQTPGAGSSKLCLSCHDGSVAVGLTVAKGTVAVTGTMTSTDVFGANLSFGHPMSMTPANDGELKPSLFATPPTTGDPTVKLVSGKVECTTCHDPHVQNNDPVQKMFLVRSNSGGAVCLACHDPTQPQPNNFAGWTTGAHAAATNTVPTTAGFGAYGVVSANACSNCHGAHVNTTGPRNLKAAEEADCTPCHGGANASPALRNITSEFAKVYAHPTMTVSGAHDAAEAVPVNNTRHAECPDCHNSHATYLQTGTPAAPAIEASMTNVSGYDTAGVIKPAVKEYQVCFKCHADSTNKPATSTYGRTAIRYPLGPMPAGMAVQTPRPADQYNLRLKFNGTIGHNVMGTSIITTTNSSLLPFMLNVDNVTQNTTRPLTTTTVLYCTDCHNNDQARSSNGTGPNGPHGSVNTHLLERAMGQDGSGGGGSTATLCGKCHNLSTIRNERPHDEHNGYSCSSCHDPHGVIGGTPGANRAMMNWDTSQAQKGTTYWGFSYSGTTGTCYTNCHDNHNGRTY